MKRLALVTLVVLTATATPALAKEKHGFYLGGSLGYGVIDVKGENSDLGEIEFDEGDLGYKLFAGYRFLPFLAVEGGYVDFGNPSSDFSFDDGILNTEIGLNGWNLAAVGILPLTIFDVYAKVGYFWWDADVRAQLGGETDNDSDSGSDLMYGIGGQVWITRIAIRAEIELYDVADADNVWLFSAGVAFRF